MHDDSCAAYSDYFTPEFMANGTIDWRSDIYALEIFGYELLTGRSPFWGKTVLETMTARMESNPAPLTSIRGDCPALLNAIVLRAMHREPKRRFQSVNDNA